MCGPDRNLVPFVDNVVERADGVGPPAGFRRGSPTRLIGGEPRVDAVGVERVAAERQEPELIVRLELGEADGAVAAGGVAAEVAGGDDVVGRREGAEGAVEAAGEEAEEEVEGGGDDDGGGYDDDDYHDRRGGGGGRRPVLRGVSVVVELGLYSGGGGTADDGEKRRRGIEARHCESYAICGLVLEMYKNGKRDDSAGDYPKTYTYWKPNIPAFPPRIVPGTITSSPSQSCSLKPEDDEEDESMINWFGFLPLLAWSSDTVNFQIRISTMGEHAQLGYAADLAGSAEENMAKTSASVSSSEESSSSSSSERVPTSGSEVGTSNPQLPLASTSHPFQPSSSQPLPSLSRKNALGDVKDQADDKANPKPWYTADEKSGKMSTEDLQDLIREYPLPEGWYARLPGLQEPANYGTKFETGIYEEQVKSGYRLPLHPFALRFFEHYRMAPGQLVPNGWRKLAGLIYLVQTSGYKPDATDFMRVFFEICFVKGVANCPGWYYIHSRQRLLKGGPKSNKGWHSRYFFVGRLDKRELPFDRDWNPFCKDFENPGKPTPNNLTKHILSHIKLRGGLCIDEPLSEEQLEWAKIIPPKPIPAGLQIPSPPLAIPSMSFAETIPVGVFYGRL
ncbi:hypothetical protein RJ639_005276 [Escallonia herrerae]|uniref:Transposase (putative) gypsy type domain-containing protein n=1 Tax=Escallonia herrerae TaxID=1293975 RepID=A0AA88W163_9ASTE|nr:hypothetical protein RJ639_005276 [Escallonia herrerae]